eukprot:Gb_36172 [translate_table: standard]
MKAFLTKENGGNGDTLIVNGQAMAMRWKSHEKIMVLFLKPMLLHLHNTKFTTISPLPRDGELGSDDDNVRALCKQGRLKEALQTLHLMDHQYVPVDSTYASLLKSCIHKKALPEGKLVHAHIIHMSERGFNPDIVLGNTLVIMYAKCGSLGDACRVLEEMPRRNVVSWTAMIAAYISHEQDEEALTLYYQMERTGIKPNEFTFASVLPACANLTALEHGKTVHEKVIRSGFQSDMFVESALVDMYVKCGDIENARQVFDKMSQRDVVSWNAMISGYAQNGLVNEAFNLFQKMPERNVVSWTSMIAGYARNGYFEEALKLFRQMREVGMKPNSDTFASVLPACANLAALEQGKQMHDNIIRRGFHSDVFVESALVDMYAKCGSIGNAWHVFDKMSSRNVVSWTAMILAYAMHGHGKKALQLFEQMQHSGTKPDHVTFIGVLSACCHAGLVDDGWRYFDCMSRYYHITPVKEHYCCMVDLLGRAGKLDEAYHLINKMPIKPDAAVWGSLLGACRIHANIELGEHVAERLFELDPKNAAPFVVLSNIYAATRRWDDIERVRKMMKDRGVKKDPGCSWIEVNKQVYAFIVGDRSHPQAQKIYAKLEILSGQMKEAGYVPDTTFVPNDVEQEQKEHIITYHSEKLAIAFGLINTSPGTPIRIVKNLRVCGDCHSAIKFISQIARREMVVRDASRFHHFKDGLCSCGDYW